MTFRRRTVLALVVGVAVFGAGIWIGSYLATHPQVQVADGSTGENVASFEVGGTTYGFRSSVTWTDAQGGWHEGGWPDCLPKQQAVKGIHLAVATLWTGDVGEAQVLWVDCRPH